VTDVNNRKGLLGRVEAGVARAADEVAAKGTEVRAATELLLRQLIADSPRIFSVVEQVAYQVQQKGGALAEREGASIPFGPMDMLVLLRPTENRVTLEFTRASSRSAPTENGFGVAELLRVADNTDDPGMKSAIAALTPQLEKTFGGRDYWIRGDELGFTVGFDLPGLSSALRGS
jgi:hypothetical protein